MVALSDTKRCVRDISEQWLNKHFGSANSGLQITMKYQYISISVVFFVFCKKPHVNDED